MTIDVPDGIAAGTCTLSGIVAEVGDGPASVTLDACAQGATQSDTYLPDCSFVNLVGKDAPSYTYVTSQGPISWSGTSASGLISFPAAEQTWPALDLEDNRTLTWTPKDIAGAIDDNGTLRMAMEAGAARLSAAPVTAAMASVRMVRVYGRGLAQPSALALILSSRHPFRGLSPLPDRNPVDRRAGVGLEVGERGAS